MKFSVLQRRSMRLMISGRHRPRKHSHSLSMEIHDSESDGDVVEVSEGIHEWVRATSSRVPHPAEEWQLELDAAEAGSSGSAHWPQQPDSA